MYQLSIVHNDLPLAHATYSKARCVVPYVYAPETSSTHYFICVYSVYMLALHRITLWVLGWARGSRNLVRIVRAVLKRSFSGPLNEDSVIDYDRVYSLMCLRNAGSFAFPSYPLIALFDPRPHVKYTKVVWKLQCVMMYAT